jgi:hypothetical protein
MGSTGASGTCEDVSYWGSRFLNHLYKAHSVRSVWIYRDLLDILVIDTHFLAAVNHTFLTGQYRTENAICFCVCLIWRCFQQLDYLAPKDTWQINNEIIEECSLLGWDAVWLLLEGDGARAQKTAFFIDETNSTAVSLQANYTDWATATSRRNLVQTFVDRRVSRGQRGGSPRYLISVF